MVMTSVCSWVVVICDVSDAANYLRWQVLAQKTAAVEGAGSESVDEGKGAAKNAGREEHEEREGEAEAEEEEAEEAEEAEEEGEDCAGKGKRGEISEGVGDEGVAVKREGISEEERKEEARRRRGILALSNNK